MCVIQDHSGQSCVWLSGGFQSIVFSLWPMLTSQDPTEMYSTGHAPTHVAGSRDEGTALSIRQMDDPSGPACTNGGEDARDMSRDALRLLLLDEGRVCGLDWIEEMLLMLLRLLLLLLRPSAREGSYNSCIPGSQIEYTVVLGTHAKQEETSSAGPRSRIQIRIQYPSNAALLQVLVAGKVFRTGPTVHHSTKYTAMVAQLPREEPGEIDRQDLLHIIHGFHASVVTAIIQRPAAPSKADQISHHHQHR